jgi:hypothetical protein
MEILNKNTFTEDKVYFENSKEGILVYIGKSCYSVKDLELIVAKSKLKDFNESLNYRIMNYQK